MVTKRLIDADITDRADGQAVLWDSASGTHVYGSAAGLPAAKAWITDNYSLDDYPASPNALDDEFEDSSLDGKWTAVNNPAGGNAFSESLVPGYLFVGLTELGTDNFANLVQLYQTAPTGTVAMEFIAKIQMTIADEAFSTSIDVGEFAGAGIALINSTDSQAIGAGVQFNDGFHDYTPVQTLGFEDNFSGFGNSALLYSWTVGQPIYVRLRKTTTAAYTSANTYKMDVSADGKIWQNVASGSKTFTTACDRVGLIYRRPKSQTNTPLAHVIVDFFRRTV